MKFLLHVFLLSVFELVYFFILLCVANGTDLLELEMYHTAVAVFKHSVLACRLHHDLSIKIKQCQNTVHSSH